MTHLLGRRILLGVTGSIAAYKSAELIRLLKKRGAEVQVVMTDAAHEFVTPMTLQALSGRPVRHTLLDTQAEAGMSHIELAQWADLVLIAPASADVIARLAAGLGDDLLTTVGLATDAPIILAPAMNQAMWRDDSTQFNVAKLSAMPHKRVSWIGPDAGEQACGDFGPGRMVESDAMVARIGQHFLSGDFAGIHVMITAGPTLEPIDPIRYISNRSSGKMGFALAEAARDTGAAVTIVAGPVNLATPAKVTRVNVETTQEMLQVCLSRLPTCQIFISAAAVCDYRPIEVAGEKIKSSTESMHLEFIKNPDILQQIALHQAPPFCVGFAAETHQLEAYAREKLARKHVRLLVANDVSQPGIGFNSDYNAATLFWDDRQEKIERTTKQKMAIQVIKKIQALYFAQHECKERSL